MAAPGNGYMSITRTFIRGTEYTDAGTFLAPYEADGWSLVQVSWVPRQLENEYYEIFYLRKPSAA